MGVELTFVCTGKKIPNEYLSYHMFTQSHLIRFQSKKYRGGRCILAILRHLFAVEAEPLSLLAAFEQSVLGGVVSWIAGSLVFPSV